MSNQAVALAPAFVSEDDYQAVLTALTATARGRAFLDEHARRARHAETEVLLAALKRLENRVAQQAAAAPQAQPGLAELASLLDTVRAVRARIDAVALSATVTELVSVLEAVQHRLAGVLAAPSVEAKAPAVEESKSPPPREVQAPFSLALTAVAAQAIAAAQPDDEPVKVLKAGSIPPPPPFAGEDFSNAVVDADADIEAQAESLTEAAFAAPQAVSATAPPLPDLDPLAPIMRLSEEERLALFS